MAIDEYAGKKRKFLITYSTTPWERDTEFEREVVAASAAEAVAIFMHWAGGSKIYTLFVDHRFVYSSGGVTLQDIFAIARIEVERV
jgi:hypothetical protein